MLHPKKVNLANEEDIKKVKELDWDTYYKKYPTEESSLLTNCPKCNVILVPRQGEAEIICYNCGEKVNKP